MHLKYAPSFVKSKYKNGGLPRKMIFFFYKNGGSPKICKIKYKSGGKWILHFSGQGAPIFVFLFYKTWGFLNTKIGAKKAPFFC